MPEENENRKVISSINEFQDELKVSGQNTSAQIKRYADSISEELHKSQSDWSAIIYKDKFIRLFPRYDVGCKNFKFLKEVYLFVIGTGEAYIELRGQIAELDDLRNQNLGADEELSSIVENISLQGYKTYFDGNTKTIRKNIKYVDEISQTAKLLEITLYDLPKKEQVNTEKKE